MIRTTVNKLRESDYLVLYVTSTNLGDEWYGEELVDILNRAEDNGEIYFSPPNPETLTIGFPNTTNPEGIELFKMGMEEVYPEMYVGFDENYGSFLKYNM